MTADARYLCGSWASSNEAKDKMQRQEIVASVSVIQTVRADQWGPRLFTTKVEDTWMTDGRKDSKETKTLLIQRSKFIVYNRLKCNETLWAYSLLRFLNGLDLRNNVKHSLI